MHRVSVQSQHTRYGGAGEVDVEDADACGGRGGAQGEGELGGDGGFADAAFSGADDDYVLDVLEAAADWGICYCGHCGIGVRRRGGRWRENFWSCRDEMTNR